MVILQTGKRNLRLSEGRIYCSISSEGYGHSSRANALAQFLPADRFLVGTYGIALERLKRLGIACREVPQEIKFVGKQGSFDIGETILQNPSRALSFNQIIQDEIDIIKEERISLVVADGRMAPVVAASRLDIPCLVVTNQSAFYPFFAKDTALVKLLGLSFEWLMKFWLSSAEEILIPDFPPPYTVCLPNLSSNFKVKKRTRFVGPLVGWNPDEIQPYDFKGDTRPSVVVSLGGHSYRRPLLESVLSAAEEHPDLRFDVLSNMSAPSSSQECLSPRLSTGLCSLFPSGEVRHYSSWT